MICVDTCIDLSTILSINQSSNNKRTSNYTTINTKLSPGTIHFFQPANHNNHLQSIHIHPSFLIFSLRPQTTMMLFGNITVCTSTISSAGAELVAEAEAAGVRAGVVTAGVATTGGAMAGGSTVVAGVPAVAPCQQADRGALGQEAWQ